MSGLHHLITMHKATMAVYKGVPDDEWFDVADQVSATIEASRAEIIKYQPQTIEDTWEKAQFMLSCRSFTEWGDIDIKDIINGFTRGGRHDANAPSDHRPYHPCGCSLACCCHCSETRCPMMFNLYRVRNEFWRVIALWACERAERSYDAFIERYDR